MLLVVFSWPLGVGILSAKEVAIRSRVLTVRSQPTPVGAPWRGSGGVAGAAELHSVGVATAGAGRDNNG
jgi:hypothetical protein